MEGGWSSASGWASRLPKCGARGTLAVRALPPAPLAAERPLCPHGIHVRNSLVAERLLCPHGTHVRNSRLVLEHASIRSPSREYPLSLSTHQSVRLHGKTHRLFFSGRSSIRTASMGTRFSVRVIAHERHFRCRSSAYSSNFWNTITLELRASLLAGYPHGPWEAFFFFVFFCFARFCTTLK